MFIEGFEFHKYPIMPINSNMYVIISGKRALIIDPNINEEAFSLIKSNQCDDLSILLTHEHIDHISGVNLYRRYAEGCNGSCTVYAQRKCADSIIDPKANLSSHFSVLFMTRSEEERSLASELFESNYMCYADEIFDDDMVLCWERFRLYLKSTPGHSPGSVCIEVHNHNDELSALFTGDSLILKTKVITRLPRGNKSDYLEITKPYLENISGETIVLPGHGEMAYMKEFEID